MHISLNLGDVRAEVDTVAARLRELSVDGVDLVEPAFGDGMPPMCSGIVLAPWPNRVADGRWVLDGELQRLDITEPELGNALHGLLEFTDYQVIGQADHMVELAAYIAPQHGWPFALDTAVRYELRPDGIAVTHVVHNRSARRAPWATGAHPYLRVGGAPVDELRLEVAAETHYPVDERLNPVAGAAPLDERTDLRRPRRVRELHLDTAYGDVRHRNPRDGVGDTAWLTAPGGARTVLWQDLNWGFMQVYTTPAYPRPDGPGTAVAVEPMTAPPDALNSGEGLVWLEPDERWSGGWGLRHEAAR
ncbi:MAG: aldose 1-epimerase family protein [Microbacteriaceae bacterium]|nr:aldose 1-epimerase family protein [Microbacteriaceae bacterium]